MSSERYRGGLAKELAKGGGKVVAAGVVMGLAGVAGVTWREHRELTHRSLEVHPLLQKAFDLEQKSMGIRDVNVWPAVHRIHHQMPDASLFPFYRVARAVKWIEENPDKAQGVQIPDYFEGFDLFVDSFSKDEVLEIGNLAISEVKDRLGDEYQEQRKYTVDELNAILRPVEPAYWYPPLYLKKKLPDDYSQDDIARILLSDPHSPALVRPQKGHLNGVKEIGQRGVIHFLRHGSDLFYARPDLKPKDLQTGSEEKDNKRKPIPEIAIRYLAPSVGVLVYNGRYKPKDYIIAAFAGSAIAGIASGIEIAGGNITNSLGHAGDTNRSRLVNAMIKKNYHLTLNPDGSVATDITYSGPLGKILSWITLDEVGGQRYHHDHPDAIAYTGKMGVDAWKEAPWGSLTAWIANSRIPLIQPGKGFEGSRPDLPHEGVQLIWKARVRQMEQQAA